MQERNYWVETLHKIANPVFHALSEERLREELPPEPARRRKERRMFAPLEAVARSLTGIAPFLENSACPPSEDRIRTELLDKVNRGLNYIVNADSPDYLPFDSGPQTLVEAAFLAQGLIRAPKAVWGRLNLATRQKLIKAMLMTRQYQPYNNNWLLFSAMVEAFLAFTGRNDWDRMRVDYALKQHLAWYKGDGIYGDGPEFHWDYYNSFVIQPMMLDILDVLGSEIDPGGSLRRKLRTVARRYTEILERLISPEGTVPPIGRSLTYRFGIFHLPALLALKKSLPRSIAPAALRCGMTAVMKRMLDGAGVFDENGWLTTGVRGSQPSLAESYISRGSLYLCSAALLPLGLPETAEFWSAPRTDWTSVRFWKGENLPADSFLEIDV